MSIYYYYWITGDYLKLAPRKTCNRRKEERKRERERERQAVDIVVAGAGAWRGGQG